MRVFVAGGTGVLGRRLVPQLVAGGHQATATTTSPVKPRPGGLRAAQRRQPSSVSQRRTHPGPGTVLLIRQAIGF